jgi:hypothetical protein
MRYIVAGLAAALLLISSARAEVDVKTYKESRSDPATKALVDNYIAGVGRGYFFMNSLIMTGKRGEPFFCSLAEFAPMPTIFISG